MAIDHAYFSVENDTASGKVDAGVLKEELDISSNTVIAVDDVDVIGDTIDIVFRDTPSSGQLVATSGIVNSHLGLKPVEIKFKVNELRHQIVEIEPNKGDKDTFVSINFCDKTSWHYDVSLVTGIVMDMVNDTTFIFPSGYIDDAIVDISHGKISFETLISDYTPKVYVDGVLQTEDSPDVNDNDFTLNYAQSGQITFNSPVTGVVTMDFYKVNSSEWIMTPDEGKMIRIVSVELQFGVNTRMTDSVIFQVCGKVGYHPALAPLEPYYPKGYEYPLKTLEYKSILDFINEANGSYPIIPKTVIPEGESATFRDLLEDVIIYKWDYTSAIDVMSSYGMELHVYCKNHKEQNGKYAIVTLYCDIRDEE